ncbi:MAG: UDP-N-acetylmuramoylalanyl-D-glutamyl-2, 6-diaminopimelate--D-alanyl-D-alanine ligase [Gemmatimonadetes bacterium]|nr:UDP-N-acetylmuramoylalanyl-D-glutamyl-2, 6-diaminopimelate--D-alanyl-D-alanine ligase [Gemmatimonadota bacterium]
MNEVCLSEIQQWTDAELVGILNAGWEPAGISTDTRTIEKGDLFLALEGPNFDGHDFIELAFERGACGALVKRNWVARGGQASGPLLMVQSPLLALGRIARNYRRRFELPVIGVVGSAGKTTVKEMVAAVLGRKYCVLKTAGNENNEVGVPQTLLQLTQKHEAVVLELAARKVGDIEYLCSIAQPRIGLLLNIGTAHIEFFGSVEGVAKAKGELLEYLDESCLALVNADDCVVVKEVKRTKGRLLAFSLERESQFRGEGLVLDQEGCGHFTLQNFPFALQVPGRHNVYNALAAATLGRALEVPWEDIQAALGAFQAVAMRGEHLHNKGIRIINDVYNANPESVRAALNLLADMDPGGGRKVAVLADMLELGARGPALHAKIGRCSNELGIDYLITTGPLSKETVKAARNAGMDENRARHFLDKAALSDHLNSFLQEEDIVLIKGSRGMKLEEVVERLI